MRTITAVGAAHLCRIIAGSPITIGDQAIPMWPSWIAIIVAGLLSWQGCVIGRRS